MGRFIAKGRFSQRPGALVMMNALRSIGASALLLRDRYDALGLEPNETGDEIKLGLNNAWLSAEQLAGDFDATELSIEDDLD